MLQRGILVFLLLLEPSLPGLLGHFLSTQQPLRVGLFKPSGLGSALLTPDLTRDYGCSFSLPKNDPQTCTSSKDLSSELHACISNCLLNTYTGTPLRHLRFSPLYTASVSSCYIPGPPLESPISVTDDTLCPLNLNVIWTLHSLSSTTTDPIRSVLHICRAHPCPSTSCQPIIFVLTASPHP